MAQCKACGKALLANATVCSCGQQVAVDVDAASPPAEGSIQGSLAQLGIELGARQIVGLVAAFIAGVIVPRVMPFVLVALYPVMSKIILSERETTGWLTLERFNTWMVTGLTLLTSFGIAFFAFWKQK